MGIDWNAVGHYAPEVVIALIVMVYTVVILRDAATERDKRSLADAAERKERDTAWQQFLKEEREARATWANNTSAQMLQLSLLVSKTNELIIQHDAWERAMSGKNGD